MKVNVIGAGFSGLVTSYFLVKEGAQVSVYEKAPKPGGLIGTERTPYGLVETAANAILNSVTLEEMCEELGLEMLTPMKVSRARYIFKGKPKRWPLSLDGSIRLLAALPFFLRKAKRAKPRPNESVSQWSSRVFGPKAFLYLVAPALQGIYAGDPDEMSASLIFNRFFEGERPRYPRIRGSVSPPQGMAQLIEKLEDYLKSAGVSFHYGQTLNASSVNEPTVFCGSAKSAAQWLKPVDTELALRLGKIEMLPLTTVTVFLTQREHDSKGFGILFPRGEGVDALGVLFNSNIFENRSSIRSETWIYRGIDMGLEHVVKDRMKALSQHTRPTEYRIQRWPEAIPHYTIELEKTLREGLKLPPKIHLMGNYLGDIGLARMLERSKGLARKIKGEGMSV